MKKKHAQYVIGIDFGTTNCTMAYALADELPHTITQFPIVQIGASKREDEYLSLPSCLYFLLDEELAAKVGALSWDATRTYCVGHFAKERGTEVPMRLISSPKSWLCHAGINRREKLLPLNAETQDIKISPLEACTYILLHLKEAWDQKMPEAPFQQQEILVTVPASFDPSARQLVQEAAMAAGFPTIILLEEPQAAFYAWLHQFEEQWRKQLAVGDRILVVDIGGGTSDFSLITVEEDQGQLQLQRTAVGAHLLLGGDNIDLALAYLAKSKLESDGHNLTDWQMQALVHAARNAKEKLFSSKPAKQADLAIMGRGSKLIGNSLKTSLLHEQALALVLDGFMPLVEPEELSKTERRLGIQQLGLPYVQDPRLTCQLAKFLSQTGDQDSNNIDEFVIPTAVLFNGGTMKASAFRERMMTQINQWATTLGHPPAIELKEGDLDYAVSRGAVYYGLARKGQGIRIKSGTSRSYYIGVEEAMPAIPGLEMPLQAICIVPFGMEEGSEQQLDNQEFSLLVGEKATFRFFSHATPELADGRTPNIGMKVKSWKQELTELHPIETELGKQEGDNKTVQVHLKSRITELGMLELYCEARDGRKWKLEFDIRK